MKTAVFSSLFQKICVWESSDLTAFLMKTNNLSSTKIETICKVSEVICIVFDVDIGQSVHLIAYKLVLVYVF
jgi:hypothetical protein